MPFRIVLLALLLGAAVRAAEPEGLFVAVGDGGRWMSSRDGRTWAGDPRGSDGAADEVHALCQVAHGLGRFIAVGGGAARGRIATTRDGRTWQELAAPPGRVATIVFGGERFIAGHGAELLWSADGEKFTAGEKLDWRGSVQPRRAAWGDGEAGPRCVLIGELELADAGGRMSWRASTADGTRYTSRALDTPPAQDVAYGSGHWVVVGPDGLIESSHDGQTWQRHRAEAGEAFSSVVWTGTRFLVGGGKVAWSSPDGLTWSKEAQALPGRLAWAQESVLGIAFSWGGGVLVSVDFAAWKKLPLPPGPSFQAVAHGALPVGQPPP